MENVSENNKRIAKNTLLLYFRMLLTMAVSLYTSRVVLSTLGVEDYGIYNVVGGVVTMFSVISGSLSAAISRFITFELGKGNKKSLEKIFSSAVTIQLALGLIILILAESIGVWFLNSKMNIPESRMYAANWVFQLSIITFIINLISVPYNATIIAHEKMSAFAYISILEVSAKLIIVYLLLISPIDRLIFYAILMAFVAFIIRFIYGYYCKRHFNECTYHFIYDKILLKKMFSFAGWNFIGSASGVLRDQGGNIIINLFCGPSVNTARSIAFQVYSAIYSFVSNFMIALNPQITKNYASGNHEYLISLLYKGARFSFYLLLLLSLPILINTNYILTLWLKNVPEHTTNFVRLVLIFALSESISQPLITAQNATGRIKNYQIVVGGLQMMNLPISYILLRIGYSPEYIFIISIIISQCCLYARLIMLKTNIKISIFYFVKDVYLNAIFVSLSSIAVPLFLHLISKDSATNVIAISTVTIMSTIISILHIGCSKKERKMIINKIKQIYKKHIHTQ